MAPRPLGDETENAGAEDVLLRRLMRAVGPLPESELRKRRVLTALRSRITSPRAARPMLRPAFAAAGLLLIGGIAGATVGRAAWDRLVTKPSAPAAPVVSAPAIAPRRISLARPTIEAPVLVPVVEPAPAVPAAPLVAAPAPTVSERNGSHVRHYVTGVELSARPVAVAADGPGDSPAETALVTAGRQALSQGHDPARARVLFDDYLAHAPNGMLAEQALAMSIKAAADMQDAEAGSLARRYLGRYPDGQFRELAHHAIAKFPDSTPIK